MSQDQFEKKIMEMSLSSQHDPHGFFWEQYLNATIISRTFTGVGFLTTFCVPDSLVKNNISKNFCEVTAEFKDTDITLLFTIFIKDGRLDFLEGFTSHGDWRYDYDNAIFLDSTSWGDKALPGLNCH